MFKHIKSKFAARSDRSEPASEASENPADWRDQSAQRTVEILRSGEISLTEYYDRFAVQNIAARDANVLISFQPDRVAEQLLELHSEQPLYGLPVLVKDNILTKDFPCSNGTAILADWNPGIDAAIVAKLRALGAVIAGKTNMPEFCQHMTCNNSTFGAVANPYAKDHFPGGSSGGSAAAVAGGLTPFAIGSDTGGSVRIPAALTGCYGFRPSTGRYSTEGIVPVTPAADTPGLFANNVSDIAWIDGLLTDEAQAVNDGTSCKNLRIGVPKAYFYEDLEPGVLAAIELSLAHLKDAKFKLIEVDMTGLAEIAPHAGFPIAFYEMMRQMSWFFLKHDFKMSMSDLVNGLRGNVEKGSICSQYGEAEVPYEVYLQSLTKFLPELRAIYQAYFDENRLDAFVAPTTAIAARQHSNNGEDAVIEHNGILVPTFPTYIRNTEPTSFSGRPAISLPCGLTPAGLPVGLEVVGKPNKDQNLLKIAELVSSALPNIKRSYYID